MMIRTRIALFAFTALAITACSDGGTGPGRTTPEFTPQLAVYMPWQVAVLTLNGPAPTTDIEGTLGAETVTLTPAGDSAVALLVPQVSGSQTLSFSAGGRSYSGRLTVTAAPAIADGQQYMESFASTADARIAAVEAQLAELDEVDPRAQELLELVRDSVDAFRARIAQLTPEQARQAAEVLQANVAAGQSAQRQALAVGVVHGTAYGAIPQVCTQKQTALQKYVCTWDEFIVKMADATIGLAGGALAAKVFAPMPWLALVVGGALIIDGGIDAAHAFGMGFELLRIHGMIAAEIVSRTSQYVWQAGSEYFRAHVYDPDGIPDMSAFALGSGMPPASMTSFTNGGTTSFVFAPQVRPVRAADRGLGVDFLARGLTLVNRYNTLIGRLGSKFQLQFAAPATSYAPYVPYGEISVEVVQNSNVRVKRVSGAGSRVDVSFESSSSNVQDFTYDIIYTSGVFPPLRVRHEAKLHPPSYRLGAVSDTTLLGDTIRIHGRMQNMFFLMHDDGSLPPNELFHVYNTANVPAGVQFAVAGNGGHYVYLNGAITTPGVVADTFDFNVTDNMNGPRTLLTATVILSDSAGLYGSSVAGSWVARTYWLRSTGEVELTDAKRFILNANGTGTYVSHTSYPGDADPVTETFNDPLQWEIRVTLEEGRPVHSLSYLVAGQWGGVHALPSYPVTGWDYHWFFGGFAHRDVWTRE